MGLGLGLRRAARETVLPPAGWRPSDKRWLNHVEETIQHLQWSQDGEREMYVRKARVQV